MTANDYVFRELRPQTVMIALPYFSNTNTTKTPKYMHHCSMYGLDEEEAQRQIQIGNTKFRQVKHYSKELVLDCDDEETAEKTWYKLCSEDYYFELWKLNNYKFYLLRDESDKPSEHMCFQDRQFVRENLFEPKMDLGIYSSPFHLIRAKGAVHEKTGAKSYCVETFYGSKLVSTNNIENFYKPNKNYNVDTNHSDWQNIQFAIDSARGQGSNNHQILWKFGMSMAKFCSLDATIELACVYARYLNFEEEKAIRAIKQAFDQTYENNKWSINEKKTA